MNKKQGSAMVMAILLLSFFMALSLNMWYISQKKAQRAGDIVVGNRVLTDIDAASTLGYYEFFLATEYMVNGFVTSPSAYTLPSSTTTYAISTSPVAFSTTIEGISLESERQYFGSYISTTGALLSTANAILEKDELSGSKLKSRIWNRSFAGAKLTELWYDMDEKSVGGYKIKSLTVAGASVNNDFLSKVGAATGTELIIETTYEKTIYFPESTGNKSITYKIEVKRETTVNKANIIAGTDGIITDSIENITVELQ